MRDACFHYLSRTDWIKKNATFYHFVLCLISKVSSLRIVFTLEVLDTLNTYCNNYCNRYPYA